MSTRIFLIIASSLAAVFAVLFTALLAELLLWLLLFFESGIVGSYRLLAIDNNHYNNNLEEVLQQRLA